MKKIWTIVFIVVLLIAIVITRSQQLPVVVLSDQSSTSLGQRSLIGLLFILAAIACLILSGQGISKVLNFLKRLLQRILLLFQQTQNKNLNQKINNSQNKKNLLQASEKTEQTLEGISTASSSTLRAKNHKEKGPAFEGGKGTALEGDNDKDALRQSRIDIQFGMRGLRNLGNTCYFNSALQCLHKTYEILQRCKQSPLGQRGRYKLAIVELLTKLSEQSQQPFAPSLLKKLVSQYNPFFEGNKQHDASQVFGTILRMLHEDMNEVREPTYPRIDEQLRKDERYCRVLWQQTKKKDQAREKSIIDDLIYGRYKTVYECQVCKQKYILFEKFHMAILPIPRHQKATLQDCFEAFCAPEVMEGMNAMYCNRCQKDQVTVKTMSIYETNHILLVSLKRFSEDAKLHDPVMVPMKIDRRQMKAQGQEGTRYRLYGMMIHSGWLDCGHYTAACHDPSNGWVLYNDSRCQSISAKKAESLAEEAYVLLYRREK